MLNNKLPFYDKGRYQKYLPNVFSDELSLYEQVMSFVEYLNTVIDNSNELNTEMIQLKEDYEEFARVIRDEFDTFTDTKFPQELTDRLQAWYDSGKLAEIINTDVFNMKADQTALDETNAQLAQIPNQTYITNKASKGSVERLAVQSQRQVTKQLPLNRRLYQLPSAFSFVNVPVNIFSDGNTFTTDYDKSRFMNTGGTTYHVSTDGSAGNDGLTESAPKTIRTAYAAAVDGDTIILHEGDYHRFHFDWQGVFEIKKNINIIGEGRVRIMTGDFKEYTPTAGYANVYETPNAITQKVIDTSFSDYGYKLVKRSTIQEVADNKGSWYTDGASVYIHMLNGDDPTGKVVNLFSGLNWFHVRNDGVTQNLSPYIENIIQIGGDSFTFGIKRDDLTYALSPVYHNVTALHGAGIRPGFRTEGGNPIFFECVSLYHENDGFSYVTPQSRGVEINCISAHNGLDNITGSDGVHNGSTAHDGGKVIRINGEYYNNFGANVADVHEGTQSVNLGCRAYNSATVYKDYRDADFTAQQAGTEMWLDSCDSWGSMFSIQAVADTTIYIRNTTFDLLGGNGDIIEY